MNSLRSLPPLSFAGGPLAKDFGLRGQQALLRTALAIALGLGSALTADAQSPFPTKAVRITAPYSAGAAPALFTRLIAEKLSRTWSQPVIVDAKPGGSGFIAIESVRNTVPDGHELLVVSNAHVAINPSLYKKLPYDPQKDFVPVAMFYHTPFYLAVASNGKYPTVPALIAAAKADPGSVSYGSSYVGSPSHLGSAEFEFLTGTRMIHAPYRDQSQMYVGIANGDVGWAFTTLGSALPLMQAGRLKLIAIAARERSSAQPDVPTMAEAGGPPGIVVGAWLAIVAPRGTPPEVVRKINADVNRLLGDPDVVQQLRTFGFEAAAVTPEELAGEFSADAKKFAELVRRTGATAD
ncbi:MAG: tripartite tricarboxylate transporter substrate-binding protein [Betaproteobacteria bacterium]